MGNPFTEHIPCLVVTDTRGIMDTALAETLRRIETLSEDQNTKFMTERLEKCIAPVTQTIPNNKLPLFSRAAVKIKSEQKAQFSALWSVFEIY